MTTRRSFVASLPAAALLARSTFAFAALPQPARLYLGTTGNKGNEGIYTAVFDAATGTLTTPALAVKTANPGFLALSRALGGARKGKRYLYCTSDVGGTAPPPPAGSPAPPPAPAVTAMISAFAVNGATLTLLNQQDAVGPGPTVLSMAADDHVVLVANYWGGSITTYTTNADGTLSLPVAHMQYRDEDHGPLPNQAQARAHAIYPSPDGGYVLADDFSGDKVRVYKLNRQTGALVANDPPAWNAPAGTTPRHMAFHPNGKWVYCVGESDNAIDLLQWDSKTGTLTAAGRISTLPAEHPPRVRSADLVLSPDARFLYASNRGYESFAVYSIGADGALTQVQQMMSGGKESRHIAIDPSGKWFLSANQRTDEISVMPRDVATGVLSPQTSSVPLLGACFALFA